MIASLYQIIAPCLFVPALARIEATLHTGSLTEIVWAVDAALRDPQTQRSGLMCERLREWRQAARPAVSEAAA